VFNHYKIRRDGVESLSKGLKGFWFANPAKIIHLVNQDVLMKLFMGKEQSPQIQPCGQGDFSKCRLTFG
jgi:hypothetical protein